MRPVLRTPLCAMLGCEYPIMLAGMGFDATPPELVAAVCNAGGFGVSGMTEYTPEQMRDEIRRIRELTSQPFGVDLAIPAGQADVAVSRQEVRDRVKREYPEHWAWVQSLYGEYNLSPLPDQRPHVGLAASFIEEQVQVVIEEQIPLLAVALGDPAWLVPRLRDANITILGLAGSLRNALRQKAAGVDIIVAQGYEAGGHTGSIASFALIPEVVKAVAPTPVVAAGGIADGGGLVAALSLGAVGVWCGTAFLFAAECGIHPSKRQGLVRGATEDFIMTRTYTGKPARDYKNELIEKWESSGLTHLPMPLQGVLIADFEEAAKQADRSDLVNNSAGQVAGRLKEIKPARQIVEDMVQQAVDKTTEFCSMTSPEI